jgi:hypothetical protein
LGSSLISDRVTTSNSELSRAEANLSALLDQRRQLTNGDSQKRNELRSAIDQRDAGIAQLTPQLAKEAEVHQKNLEGIREACRIIRDSIATLVRPTRTARL